MKCPKCKKAKDIYWTRVIKHRNGKQYNLYMCIACDDEWLEDKK